MSEEKPKPGQEKQIETETDLNPLQKMLRRKTMMQDKSLPHITNLHEDEQMSGMVFYSLSGGKIRFGRKTGNPPNDVILAAIGIK